MPHIVLQCTSGRWAGLEACRKALLEEAEKCRGTAMIFSLVTLVEDMLSSAETANAQKTAMRKEGIAVEAKTITVGTTVTVEAFLAWNKAFLDEQKTLRSEQAVKAVKLTGRQLFEQNKVVDMASDDLGIDEAVFEGLDTLQVVSDPEASDNGEM